MSDNIFGTTPTSTLMSVAEAAAKVMQGQQSIEEQDESWLDDEARDVEHKWKRMNTKLRVKWLAQIKVKADKEDMSQEKLDKILDEYGLTKFPKEKVWNEVQKIKPKWKKMSTAERTRWIDDLNDIAVKVRTSDADVQSILDDAKLKIKEEVEVAEAFFKVSIPDIAPTFVESESVSQVKANMRKILKPDVVKELEIERVTPAAMKKMYRDMAKGKEEIDEAVLVNRDYKYDGKVIKISKKNFSKVSKDYKNDTAGKERMITYDSKWGTVSVPVEFTEGVEIDEAKEFWAVIDKAKGGEVMAISSDEKGAKSSVKMSNFSKHDYHFGKDPRTLKIVKVAGSYKQGEKMIGTKLSFKEEVEITETVHDKKSTFTMAPFEDLRGVADVALKIMQRQPQEVKEEEKEEVTKEDQPQSLTEEIV